MFVLVWLEVSTSAAAPRTMASTMASSCMSDSPSFECVASRMAGRLHRRYRPIREAACASANSGL